MVNNGSVLNLTVAMVVMYNMSYMAGRKGLARLRVGMVPSPLLLTSICDCFGLLLLGLVWSSAKTTDESLQKGRNQPLMCFLVD